MCLFIFCLIHSHVFLKNEAFAKDICNKNIKQLLKTMILSLKVKDFLSRERAERQNLIFLVSQPASQPASGPKIHDAGPPPFPETRNPSLLRTVSQFLYLFNVFLQMSLAKAWFCQKTKVLLRTSVKNKKTNIKTVILSLKVKDFLSRGRADGQNPIFWDRWLAGWRAQVRT